MSKSVVIIGAGFAGLSAAAFMAKAGWQVTVVEKNGNAGGRAQQLKAEGFTFDMGPSWYWMPDVFERFFNQFGKTVADYYSLTRLNPSYRVYWPEGHTDLPANFDDLLQTFQAIEPGSASALKKYLTEAAIKYKTGMQDLVYKPGQSVMEFMDWAVIKNALRLQIFTSISSHVAAHFKSEKLRQLMEFPVLFLGALPQHTPALYSLMNYADIQGGTWYPAGGFYSVVKAMQSLAEGMGVQFRFSEAAEEIVVTGGAAKSVRTGKAVYSADAVISGADYAFTEQQLLPLQYRTYTAAYWNKKVLAPSCLLYYIGLNKKLRNAQHHALFFDMPFGPHGRQIYTDPQWPDNPLFYVNVPSVTEPDCAPAGCENLMFLIPIAAGLQGDTEALRDRYFSAMVQRYESRIGEPIMSSIIYKKSFSVSDFITEYNSLKGNAYGLANTLRQTAVLRPSCHSKKVANLFYTGQLTVPGPGVPPSLISGEVVSKQLLKLLTNTPV